MSSVMRNPACRYQTTEAAPQRLVEVPGQVEPQGFLNGLRVWQESCPCCFSEVHPEGVPTGPPMALDAEDVAYVRREFMPLEEACIREGLPLGRVRGMVHRGGLPKPPYVLPDGTEMVSTDYFDLLHDAGSVERLRTHFVDRFLAAASAQEEPASPEEATNRGMRTFQASTSCAWRTPLRRTSCGRDGSCRTSSNCCDRLGRTMRPGEPSSDRWWMNSMSWSGRSPPTIASGSVRRAPGNG